MNNPEATVEDAKNVLYNIMSYHQNSTRLTELQLDRWADAMDNYPTRKLVRSGDSWFVRPDELNGNGDADSPFNSIAIGVTNSNTAGGDIIYFFPGNHPLPDMIHFTIEKPVTLRAMRRGVVVIGL